MNFQSLEVSFSFKGQRVIIKGIKDFCSQQLTVAQEKTTNKIATLDYLLRGIPSKSKRKLVFEQRGNPKLVDSNFFIVHNHKEEEKEDHENFATAEDVPNCLGKSNLGGLEL